MSDAVDERAPAGRRSSLRSWDDVRSPVEIVTVSEHRRDGTRAGRWIALAFLAIAGAAYGGYRYGREQASDEISVVTVTLPAIDAPAPVTSTATVTTVAATSSTVATTTTAPAPTTTVATTTTIAVPDGPVVGAHGVVLDGRLVLRGSFPSREAIDAAAARARARFEGLVTEVVVEMVPDPRVEASSVVGAVVLATPVRFTGTAADEASRPVVSLVAGVLARVPGAFVVADSYVDDQGDATRNAGLAKQRLDLLVDVLVERGVSPDRVVPAVRGADKPLGDSSTADGRAMNRRIELTLHGIL